MTVCWLESLTDDSLPLAGSKITRLAELARAGLTVPTGFVVTTHAFKTHLAGTGLAQALDAEIARIKDPHDIAVLTEHANHIQHLFDLHSLDSTLATAITEAYEELCDRRTALALPVAVRSSATGEDASDASFAGQFETYLGLTGAAQVIDGVRRCWASLFTPRALGYRRERGLSHHDSPMAVGVLELVNARASGVAFSIHPVTGKRDRIVVESSWGWGEAIVQGLVTPDHFEIDKSDGRVLRREINSKTVVSTFDYQHGRVVEAPMPARLRERASLDDEQLAAIVTAVKQIEDHYDYPVDVEWVLDQQRRAGEPITIVQARPETVQVTTAKATPQWDVLSAANKYVFNKK
ncbi:MAG: pyruvate kinase [Gammaproteobacteria bacterium]|nr:pyruvate kinase [Gammaproteobacteria bacterium]